MDFCVLFLYSDWNTLLKQLTLAVAFYNNEIVFWFRTSKVSIVLQNLFILFLSTDDRLFHSTTYLTTKYAKIKHPVS